MQTTSTEDSDYVNAVLTPQITMEYELTSDTMDTPNADMGSTHKKRRHSKSPTEAASASDRSTMKKQRNQDENAAPLTDITGTKSELYFLTQNDITKIVEGRDSPIKTDMAPTMEGKCSHDQDSCKCERKDSIASDIEENSPNPLKKDMTLLSMLRSMKNRIKESNKSPKAFRTTVTTEHIPPPPDDFSLAHNEDYGKEDDKISNTQNLARENNLMLKTALMEIRQNGSSIDCLSDRMNEIEELMDKSLKVVDSRLDTCETKTHELAESMDSKFTEIRSYTDEKLAATDQKLIKGLSNLENTWKAYKSEIQEQIAVNIKTGIEQALCSTDYKLRTNLAIDERLAKMKIDTDKTTAEISMRLSKRVDKLHKDHCEKTKAETSELQQLLSQLKAGTYQSLVSRGGSDISKEEWHAYRSRTEQSAARLDSLTVELRKYGRKIDSLDNKSRRNNAIIDMLYEREGENTKQLIEEILDQGLNEDDRSAIKIKRAFRLGIKRPYVKTPRKIFLELAEPDDRIN